MVLTNDFVFLHVQKTAGSFIEQFMYQNIESSIRGGIKHGGYHSIKESHRGKKIFAVVRNPWDWHVSWYHSNIPALKTDAFGPVFVGKTFEQYVLDMKHDSKFKGLKTHDIQFDDMLSCGIGVYTYRHSKLTLKSPDFSSYSNLLTSYKDSYYLDNVCKFETLREDLIDYLKLDDKQIKAIISMGNKNVSDHKHYSSYYTPEMVDIIADKERLMIERYGYEYKV